jgi:type I restriction enzyme S subunit
VTDLPPGWALATLGDCFDVTPGWTQEPHESDVISVVPMAAVEAATGRLNASQVSRWGDIRSRSLTRFQEEDLLFAKITPCMENGKIAIARNLHCGFGVGSTEFHVLRSRGAVRPAFALHFLLQTDIRRDAQRHMSGAVGQRRVPRPWLGQLPVPVPPLREQRRIIDVLEPHVSRLDAATVELARGRARLERFIQTLASMSVSATLDAAGSCRRIPPTWTCLPLAQLAINASYGTSAKCSYDGEGAPVLRIPNVAGGRVNLRTSSLP